MTGEEGKGIPAVFDRDGYTPWLSAHRYEQVFVFDFHAHSPAKFEYTGRYFESERLKLYTQPF